MIYTQSSWVLCSPCAYYLNNFTVTSTETKGCVIYLLNSMLIFTRKTRISMFGEPWIGWLVGSARIELCYGYVEPLREINSEDYTSFEDRRAE